MSRRMYAGGAQPTALSAPMTNADTSLTVVSGTNYPDGSTGKAVLTLDAGLAGEEKVLYTARTGNTFTGLTRGYDGTTAVSHSSGASVRHTISGIDLDEANAHINDTTLDQHTQYAFVKKTIASLRGAAGRSMKFHYGTDTGLLAVDDGSTWHEFQDKAASDAAYAPIGSGALSAVLGARVIATEATNSTSYADLATVGPTVTVTIGASGRALVLLGCGAQNDSAGAVSRMAFAVSGATTRAATDDEARVHRANVASAADNVAGAPIFLTGLTPGSNTFTAKYNVSSGNGTFERRHMTVIPL